MNHITEVMCIPSVQQRPRLLDRSHDRRRIGKRTTLVDRLQHQVASFFSLAIASVNLGLGAVPCQLCCSKTYYNGSQEIPSAFPRLLV